MGIVKNELGATVLPDGRSVRVEYNEGDIIHIHIGDFRLDFSPDEFDRFARAVEAGKIDLLEVKDLESDLDVSDTHGF